jgi:hypothetical protein
MGAKTRDRGGLGKGPTRARGGASTRGQHASGLLVGASRTGGLWLGSSSTGGFEARAGGFSEGGVWGAGRAAGVGGPWVREESIGATLGHRGKCAGRKGKRGRRDERGGEGQPGRDEV